MNEKQKPQSRLKVLRTGDPRSQFNTFTAEEILERLGRPRYLLSRSSKTRKSESVGVLTRVLYLSPGVTCPAASKGCLANCLGHSSGFMKERHSTDARDRRTALFIVDRPAFIGMLRNEICQHASDAQIAGLVPAVRLNGTSDFDWVGEYPELFHEIPAVYYDYSKRIDLVRKFLERTCLDQNRCEQVWPSNYHLTFSLNERNAHHAEEVLERGGNVAAVFWPELPEQWRTPSGKAYPVISGDDHDFRPFDTRPAVVGLLAKGFVAQEDDRSGFVIRTDESPAPTLFSANTAA